MFNEPSDGVFRFYWTEHEECEFCHGPFDTVEAAKANAISDFENTSYGADPGSTIWIVHADKRLTIPVDFGPLVETFLEVDFDRAMEAMWEAFGETNETCFGEDGFEGLSSAEGRPAENAYAALEVALRFEIDAWRKAMITDETILASGMTKAFSVWQDLFRANIKTWCFGQVRDSETFVLPSFGSEAADEAFIHARIAKSLGMTPEAYAAARAGLTTTV